MAAEVTAVAGPWGKHQSGRTATRHGAERGTVTLGGRRLPIRRPRVRTADGRAGVPLASYGAFSGGDLLAEGIVARMLAGLSTRRYLAGLERQGPPRRHPAALRPPVGEHGKCGEFATKSAEANGLSAA